VFPKSERFYNLLFLKKFKFFHLPLDRSNIGCPFLVLFLEFFILLAALFNVWEDVRKEKFDPTYLNIG